MTENFQDKFEIQCRNSISIRGIVLRKILEAEVGLVVGLKFQKYTGNYLEKFQKKKRVEAVEVGILRKNLRTKLQIPEVQVGIFFKYSLESEWEFLNSLFAVQCNTHSPMRIADSKSLRLSVIV